MEDVGITVLVDNAKGAPGLRSQWGLSFWVQTPTLRFLLDCGASDAFLRNARRLEVPVESAQAFVLSHGHSDHGGGLHKLTAVAPEAALVMHPAALTPRFWLAKNGKVESIGLAQRDLAALRAAAPRIVWSEGPLQLAPDVWVTGPVPRRHPLEEAERNFFLDEACTVRDQVVDDQAAWVETPAGLVVLCGCAHSGVINTVRYVRELVAARMAQGGAAAPAVKLAADGSPAVRALLGGIHLLQARKDRLQQTADYLEALDLELCGVCHCTGKRATSLLRERLPRACAEVATGCSFSLAYAG